MDEVTLYNLHNRVGNDVNAHERLDRLERAFARHLRQNGMHLRDIANLLDIKMADVKRILNE